MSTCRTVRNNIIAQTTLSPRELDVAMLARVNLGRNAISSALGLSVNSVKTIIKRIETKLGPGWRHNRDIIWPQPDAAAVAETAAAETAAAGNNHLDDFEDGYYHRLERELARQRKGRGISMRLVITQSRAGRDILHVTSAQRFWLRPALTELEDRKYIKLLAVDWNETFAPAWLPLVYRGRKEIRAADYVTYHGRHVIAHLRDYLEHRLQEYILKLNSRLEEVRSASRRRGQITVPDLRELAAMAMAEFAPR